MSCGRREPRSQTPDTPRRAGHMGKATHHLVQVLRSMPVWACAQRMAVRTSTCGSAWGSRPSREGDHSPPTSTASSSFRPSKNCREIRDNETWPAAPMCGQCTAHEELRQRGVKATTWGSTAIHPNQPPDSSSEGASLNYTVLLYKVRGPFSSETLSFCVTA